METPVTNRPYRSHKFPACNRCRQRKVACNVDQPGQKCMLCREKGWDCVSSPPTQGVKRTQSDAPDARRVKKVNERQQAMSTSDRMEASGSNQHASHIGQPPSGTAAGNKDIVNRSQSNVQAQDISPAESSMIVGPVIAEDIQVLEPYLTQGRGQPTGPPGGCSDAITSTPSNPILYLSVPRRRDELNLARHPGASQMEIMMQIVRPFCNDLINLYFDYIHPSFPVLDEDSIRGHQKKSSEVAPPALFCELLAIALPLWSRSSKLSSHPRPDILYCWNLAVAALQDEFLAPSISTVQCATVDLIGRPSIGMIGNIVNEGRTTALAYTFGLNRNPESWKCSSHEKKLRTRAWWGVLINNRWSSFAHGVPTTLARNHYDVPVPVMADLIAEGASLRKVQAVESFLHLCTLSDILGDILPIAYNLTSSSAGYENEQKEIRRLRVNLDDWEANLPLHLQQNTRQGYGSHLNFCLLSMRVVLNRIALKICSNDRQANAAETRRYRLAMLRASAQDVADFVVSLTSLHLAEFWLPYTAHLLASAAMILLRCTIDTVDPIPLNSCKSSLRSLRQRLRSARDEDEWDLADIFLSQCDGPISRFLDAHNQPPRSEGVRERAVDAPDGLMVADFDVYSGMFPGSGSDFGISFTIESLGDPRETLWSMFDFEGAGAL